MDLLPIEVVDVGAKKLRVSLWGAACDFKVAEKTIVVLCDVIVRRYGVSFDGNVGRAGITLSLVSGVVVTGRRFFFRCCFVSCRLVVLRKSFWFAAVFFSILFLSCDMGSVWHGDLRVISLRHRARQGSWS